MGEFNPALSIADFKVPVSIWGKLVKMCADLGWLPLREHDSHNHVKNSFNTIPIGGCVQSCTDYLRSEVPMGEARQK